MTNWQFLFIVFAITGHQFLLGTASVRFAILLLELVMLRALLWRPGTPSTLFWIAFFSWVNVLSAHICEEVGFHTIYWSPSNGQAIWYSAAATLALGTGMSLSYHFVKPLVTAELSRAVLDLNPARLALVWFSLFALKGQLSGLGFITHLGLIRFIPLSLLAARAVLDRDGAKWFAVALVTEYCAGAFGFFSDFKTPLIASTIAFLGAGAWSRAKFSLSVIVAAGALSMVLWTAIKPAVRGDISAGSGQQIVAIDRSSHLEVIVRQIGSLTVEDLIKASETLLVRMGYTEFFGQALDYIPRARGYSNGEAWTQAFIQSAIPRALNPGKAIVDDSDILNEATGLRVANRFAGVSISLGYPGESYADLGIPLMYLPIFLLGAAFGAIRVLLHVILKNSLLAEYAMLCYLFVIPLGLGGSLPKMIGGPLTASFVLLPALALCGRAALRWVGSRPAHSAR